MGLGGLEPPTSRLSGVRSNQLSYRPTPRCDAAEIEPVEMAAAPTATPRLGAWLASEPGRTRAGRTTPGRESGQASMPPEIQKERRIAHGPESPGGRPRICRRASRTSGSPSTGLPRKEVIQPHLPVRLPCYDLAPITGLTLGACLLTVGVTTSGAADFRGLTGGVYKARERIHRCLLISDY